MYRIHGLHGKADDLLKLASATIPAGGGGGGVSKDAAAGATEAALDYLYSKEQERVRSLLLHSDEVVVKVGRTVDWTRWAIGGLAAAGVVLLLRKALRKS